MPPALNSIAAMATRWSAIPAGSASDAVIWRMIWGYQVVTLQKAISAPVASAVQTSIGRRSGASISRRRANRS